MIWYVYIVQCNDGTLYTGTTNNLNKRIEMHNKGTGARYTRGRGPVHLRASFEFETRSLACKEEYRIKQLTKVEKMSLL